MISIFCFPYDIHILQYFFEIVTENTTALTRSGNCRSSAPCLYISHFWYQNLIHSTHPITGTLRHITHYLKLNWWESVFSLGFSVSDAVKQKMLLVFLYWFLSTLSGRTHFLMGTLVPFLSFCPARKYRLNWIPITSSVCSNKLYFSLFLGKLKTQSVSFGWHVECGWRRTGCHP